MSSSKLSLSPTARGSSPGGVRRKQVAKQLACPLPFRDNSNTRRKLFDANAVVSLETHEQTDFLNRLTEVDRSAQEVGESLRQQMNEILTTMNLIEAGNEKQYKALQGRVLFLEEKLSEAQDRIEELEAKLGEKPQEVVQVTLDEE